MFGTKKRKSILASKEFKIERTSVHYRNPFNLKKGIWSSKLFRVLNLILFLAIFGCLYFFIFSNFYNITNIEVAGNQIISTDDVLDITNNYLNKNTLLIFKNRNIFLFNRNSLKNKISQIVILDNLKIEKILPNTIRLTLKEKNAALKWINNDEEYLVDPQGMIIKRFYKLEMPAIFNLANPTESTSAETTQTNDNLIKITNKSTQAINLGDKVLNPTDVAFIQQLVEKSQLIDYLKITGISVPNTFPQFILVQLDKGQVYFNLADSLDNQLNRLDLLVNQKIKKQNLGRIDYIDLRLGESIYYKFKEQTAE